MSSIFWGHEKTNQPTMAFFCFQLHFIQRNPCPKFITKKNSRKPWGNFNLFGDEESTDLEKSLSTFTPAKLKNRKFFQTFFLLVLRSEIHEHGFRWKVLQRIGVYDSSEHRLITKRFSPEECPYFHLFLLVSNFKMKDSAFPFPSIVTKFQNIITFFLVGAYWN